MDHHANTSNTRSRIRDIPLPHVSHCHLTISSPYLPTSESLHTFTVLCCCQSQNHLHNFQNFKTQCLHHFNFLDFENLFAGPVA